MCGYGLPGHRPTPRQKHFRQRIPKADENNIENAVVEIEPIDVPNATSSKSRSAKVTARMKITSTTPKKLDTPTRGRGRPKKSLDNGTKMASIKKTAKKTRATGSVEENYDVKTINGIRLKDGILEYNIQWTGNYPNEWIAAKDCESSFENCPDKIKAFEAAVKNLQE